MQYVETLFAVGNHPVSWLIRLTGEFSHGAIYDRERNVAIEAKGSLSAYFKMKFLGQKHLKETHNRVVETPIEDFIKRYDGRVEIRLMAVRDKQKALEGYRAKAKAATEYDTTHLLGFALGLAEKFNTLDKVSCIEFMLSEAEYCGQPWQVTPTALYHFTLPAGSDVGSLK